MTAPGMAARTALTMSSYSL
uniref:Uncharacterized protein n=1 Tax=Solanum lycopersicum TaxID=4081 RepID=A0A3Q7I2T1_SOLLC